jgi:hypothetical protein
MVPVRLVDVSDATADAMTAADNAAALQGTDDPARLLELLATFGRGSDLLADMGFADAALDALSLSAGDALLGAAGDTSPALGDLAYRLVVECRDEAHQAELLQRLEAEGLSCSPLIS